MGSSLSCPLGPTGPLWLPQRRGCGGRDGAWFPRLGWKGWQSVHLPLFPGTPGSSQHVVRKPGLPGVAMCSGPAAASIAARSESEWMTEGEGLPQLPLCHQENRWAVLLQVAFSFLFKILFLFLATRDRPCSPQAFSSFSGLTLPYGAQASLVEELGL